MKTLGKRRLSLNEEDTSDPSSSKRKVLIDFIKGDDELERQKLTFKKEKFESEMAEKEKDRDERREIHPRDRTQAPEAMTALVQAALDVLKNK